MGQSVLVKARARDSNGREGDWTTAQEVLIPAAPP